MEVSMMQLELDKIADMYRQKDIIIWSHIAEHYESYGLERPWTFDEYYASDCEELSKRMDDDPTFESVVERYNALCKTIEDAERRLKKDLINSGLSEKNARIIINHCTL